MSHGLRSVSAGGILAALTVVLAWSIAPNPAIAQQGRAALLEAQRQQKQAQLQPYEPGKLERLALWYEETDPLGKVAPYNGFYLEYGFRWKPTGAGVGLGGGFRHDLFNRRARLNLEAGITQRNYQLLVADFSLPYLADERIELGAFAAYRHNPQEDYWGLGSDSLKDDRVSYRVDYRDYQARAIARPRPWLEAGVRVGRLDGSLGGGTDSRFPSIEERFNDATAPGLGAQPDFVYGEVSGAIDYRDQEDNARSGGYYALTWRRYADQELDRYSFRETDARLMQFFPIFDKKRVFAVQARLVTTSADSGQQVPFYFKPTLGGSTSLRSFRDFRFRDDTVAHVNVEYRWEAFSGLDMALFSDWGAVASGLDALDLDNLRNAYGIGFRFNNYRSVWFRVDLGLGGSEGLGVFWKFGKAF